MNPNTNGRLVTPRSIKGPKLFSEQFYFYNRNVQNFGKIWQLMVGKFDLTNSFYFLTNLSAVTLSVFGESFNCSYSLN